MCGQEYIGNRFYILNLDARTSNEENEKSLLPLLMTDICSTRPTDRNMRLFESAEHVRRQDIFHGKF